MPITNKSWEALFYETGDGRKPAQEWLENLKDIRGKAKIYARIRRCEAGNFGSYRELGEDLYELKEPFGAGYRVYFTISRREEVVLLLLGGDKSTQTKDIEKARKYLYEYKKKQIPR